VAQFAHIVSKESCCFYQIFGGDIMISMKKTALGLALGVACGVGAVSAQAATLSAGDTLTINAGLNGTPFTTSGGVYVVPSLCAGNATTANGSCFGMQGSAGFGFVSMGNNNGIVIGAVQPASGSHSGQPGTVAGENPGIDTPWGFFNNTGMHQTTSAVTQLTSTTGGGTLNFSGWNVTWNGLPSIPMGAGGLCQNTVPQNTNGSNCNGSASFAWDGVYGSQYQLWYNATVPAGDPSGFGNVNYRLHLVGTVVQAVPVPAAVWLLGSGLLGLVGVARRKKVA
jgi:hypothetical protein